MPLGYQNFRLRLLTIVISAKDSFIADLLISPLVTNLRFQHQVCLAAEFPQREIIELLQAQVSTSNEFCWHTPRKHLFRTGFQVTGFLLLTTRLITSPLLTFVFQITYLAY